MSAQPQWKCCFCAWRAGEGKKAFARTPAAHAICEDCIDEAAKVLAEYRAGLAAAKLPPPPRERDFWTPDRVTQLRELWGIGLSASQVGERLGTTKNAVIGKIDRLKLFRKDAAAPATMPAPDMGEPFIRPPTKGQLMGGRA